VTEENFARFWMIAVWRWTRSCRRRLRGILVVEKRFTVGGKGEERRRRSSGERCC